jgi:hypothetical protein
LYISGTPPAASMARRQLLRALDVEDDGAAGHAGQHVACEQHHLAVRVDVVALLGDDAQAVTVAVKGQAELGVGILERGIRSRRFSGLLGSGWWLGKLPSTSLNSSITSQPIARKIAGAEAPAMPLPQSTTIFILRASLMSDTMRSV